MSFTYQQVRTLIQQAIADSSNVAFVDACIDQAQREVARARRWPELMFRSFFNTMAAYDTGTVAVTNGSTTVTLAGGTWPATVASSKWRFALSVSDPWYEVATRSSGAIILLAQAYQGDDDTSTDYIAYRSHYSLASTVDRVEEMWLHDEGTAIPLVNAATDENVTEFLHYPSGPGTPWAYYPMERDSNNYRQVLLGPETPDDVYRVEYTYKKKTTDGTFTGNLDESRWPVILARALSLAYAPEFYDRSVAEYQKYQVLLAQEWAHENETSTQWVRVGQTRVSYPGQDYYETMMGRGHVEDP